MALTSQQSQQLYGSDRYTAWGEAEAAADARAKGIQPGSGSSNGSSSFQPLGAPDLKALEDKVYNQLKPYYLQLLKESDGDYTRAVDILKQDYAKGTRVAKEDYSRNTAQTKGELGNTLDTLGINFKDEQGNKIDELNKRGMATSQTDPNGVLNKLGITLPSAPSYDPSSGNLATLEPNSPDMSGITGPAPIANVANLGYGGHELNTLKESQRLRQEAIQRTANNKIQQLGVDYTRYTNPNATDPSQKGTAELGLSRGIDEQTRQKQQRGEALYTQLQDKTLGLASGFAGAGIKADAAKVDNLYNKGEQQTFINQGV